MAKYEVELPSGAKIVFKNWSLKWANEQVRSKIKPTKRVGMLLSECTESIIDPGIYASAITSDGKLDWGRVLTCDRDVALIAIRIATHGQYLPIQQKCGLNECTGLLETVGYVREQFDDALPSLNLDRLLTEDIYMVPEEVIDNLRQGINRFSVKFGGHDIEFKLMTGNDADWAEEFVKSDPAHSVTRMIASRIVRFDQYTHVTDIEQALHRSSGSLTSLINVMAKYDGGIEDEVEMECPKCLRTAVMQIPLLDGQAFWDPYALTASKSRVKRKDRLSNSSSEKTMSSETR
jgi:hypothetical protein